MSPKGTIDTWGKIREFIPTRPSIRSLQKNWQRWHVPVRRSVTGKRYCYVEELSQWVERWEKVHGVNNKKE